MSAPGSSESYNSSGLSVDKSSLVEEFTLRVMTLNCWGLWLYAKKRRQRINGIVRYIRENNCDIVFLQEVWVTSDFEIIREGTKDIYLFAHLFRSGSVLGSSGIVILCKWFPKVIHFEPYSLNGSPFYPWHGDWFAGKGTAYSRVDFDGLSLHLFSTHTHAYYHENESIYNQYSVHRICQSYQLARFITFIADTACNKRSNGKDLLIVAGDMNSTSSELPYKILTKMAGLTDCFKASRLNPASNIIHKHKITSLVKTSSLSNRFEESQVSSNVAVDPTNLVDKSFCRSKFTRQNLSNTLDEYKNKLVHALFDSDTDDEDITYCHPRNSFTPGFGLSKLQFKDPILYNNNSSSVTTIQKTTIEQIRTNDTPNNQLHGGDDDDDDKNDARSTIYKQQKLNSQKPNEGRDNNNNNNNNILSEKKDKKRSQKKRIDFILCRLLTHGRCVVDRAVTEPKDPSLDCSLSDHEPVMVELKISDYSHDLMDKNSFLSSDKLFSTNKPRTELASRPLTDIVEPRKLSLKDTCQEEETTDQWVTEEAPANLSSNLDLNIQVLEETQDILLQYCDTNRTWKTHLFFITLIAFVTTLSTVTYYALCNELIPLSALIFMWIAGWFLFAIILLIVYLSYRFEIGAIQAILNDITCKISVAKSN